MWKHPCAFMDLPIARERGVRAGGICLVGFLVILRQRIGATNRRAQILRVARHFIETQITVSVFADNMRLDVILAMIAPTGVALASRIGRWIPNASPNVT